MAQAYNGAPDILAILTDDVLKNLIDEGRNIITIGDYCTEYVWSKFGQPKLCIIDGVTHIEQDDGTLVRDCPSAVQRRIIAQKIKRHTVYNQRYGVTVELCELIRSCLKSPDKEVIFSIGEEDCTNQTVYIMSPENSVLIYGDNKNRCMCYHLLDKDNTDAPLLDFNGKKYIQGRRGIAQQLNP